MSTPLELLDEKTKRYVSNMPYLKAVILSELQNDIEIYSYINLEDIALNTHSQQNMESYLNGLRAGMNELFTDFKKQFEKLQTSNSSNLNGNVKEEVKSSETAKDNYSVSIMYDNYYVRK